MNFDNCMEFVLKWEGGEVDDSTDPGGHTKYGISKRAHPDVDIASLTLEDAKNIYFEEYWEPIEGHLLPPGVDLLVFDGAVNQGVNRAVKALQKALGVKVDGVIGPVTMWNCKTQYENNAQRLIQDIGAARGHYYLTISADELRQKYGYGWMRRLLDCHLTANKMVNT